MASGEDKLIATFFQPAATHPGALSLRDDAAVLRPPEGHDLVLTADAIVAGVHFFPDDPADTIACKALRVNLSDLAAKGAKPAGCLLTLAIPQETDETWLGAFAGGLHADADHYGCPLLGGDTVRTPGPVTISIFAIGHVPAGRMVQRRGARPGDRILVTGSIGDAALGLKLRRSTDAGAWKLDHAQQEYLRERYLIPQPRVGAADAMRAHASAAMDVSDGLAGDLAKLCQVSGVSARVEADRVPLSDAARAAFAGDPAVIETILTGGDDYEIVCTVPADGTGRFHADMRQAGIAAAEIGEIVAGEAAPQLIDGNGRPLTFARTSFSHF